MRQSYVKAILHFLEKNYGKQIKRHPSNDGKLFRLLIGTMLSHRTKDEKTWPANERLFKVIKSPKEMLRLSPKEIERLIYPVGFYRQKAKKILKVSKIILEKYNGKVPENREELMELPGVGPKTADIILMYGLGKPSIAVDTHVNRVSKRIGLAPLGSDVEEVRETLQKTFPIKKWYLINLGFILFGKKICKPIGPLCIKDLMNCPFSGFCKAYITRKFNVK